VAHERYWRQQAQDVPVIEAGREAAAAISHTYAEFGINRETREVIVRIIDAESGKLVRTLPPDKLVKEIQPNQLRRRAVLV
jgi:uncharacterized FlaG/YvyC family protein